jgi:hypothetical protein
MCKGESREWLSEDTVARDGVSYIASPDFQL